MSRHKTLILFFFIFLVFLMGIGLFAIFLSKNTKLGSNIPKISVGGKVVQYGLSSDVFSSSIYTGKISSIKIQNNILLLELQDLTSSQKYIFHFANFLGVAVISSFDQQTITFRAIRYDMASSELNVGEYASIKFDIGSQIASISEMVSNESGYPKSIIIYNYVH